VSSSAKEAGEYYEITEAGGKGKKVIEEYRNICCILILNY
jgi:hypothetical protein